jgi:hypothetical protein
MQLWRIVTELTEQLAQNRSITASLQAQAGAVNVSCGKCSLTGINSLYFALKSAASHQGTGFALRRYVASLYRIYVSGPSQI